MSRTALFAVVTLIALASTASASGSGSWGSGSGSLAVEDSSPEPEPSNKSPQPEPEPSKPSPSPEPEPQTSKAPEPPARKTMTVNATVLTGAAKTAVKKKFADLKMTATMEKVQVASAVTLSIPIADIKAGTPARTKFEADFQKGYTNATGLPCKVSAVTATTRRMLEGATRRQLAVGVKVDFYSEVPKEMAADAASLVKTAKSEGLSIPLKVGTKDYTVALNTMEEPTVTFAPNQDCAGNVGTCAKDCKATYTQTAAQSGTGKACAHAHNANVTCSGGTCPEAATTKSGAASTAASLALVCGTVLAALH